MTSKIVLETKYGKIIRATPQASGTTLFCRLPYTKKPSPIEPNSNPQRRDDVSKKRLTVKLRGRAPMVNQRRRRILSSRARGAEPQAVHGPLQRLLDSISLIPRHASMPSQQDSRQSPKTPFPREVPQHAGISDDLLRPSHAAHRSHQRRRNHPRALTRRTV